MIPNFLLFRKIVLFSFLTILVTVVSFAQFNLSELKREIELRGLYTTTQNQKGEIFAGTWGAGIWKSTNDGNSWFRSSDGLGSYDIRKIIISDNSKIFAATSLGLYYSDNNGAAWNIIPAVGAQAGFKNIILKGNTLLLFSDSGYVFQSSDNGVRWSENGKIPEGLLVVPIGLTTSNKIIAGTDKGLYLSDNNGKSWSKLENYISGEIITGIYNVNGKIFVVTYSKGLFVSSDDGKTVSALNDGLGSKKVKFITSDNGAIFLSTKDDGIYSLDEERDVWKKVNKNFGPSVIEFISMKKGGKMIAGSSTGSVFISQDAGLNWAESSGKLICAIPNTKFVEVKASDKIEKSYLPPPIEFYKNRMNKTNKTNSATVIVTYTGFSPEAQTAFQYAIDIWSSIITSAVPIRVSATYTALGAGVLGSAGPATSYTGFLNQPYANTWYPVALAEKINGDRLNLNTNPDIVANFSSAFSNWYLGTDGNTPFSSYDFVSVVLHELCHGLGYVASFDYSGGSGSWGDATYHYPMVFDRFLYNGSGQLLMNTALFINPSTDLGSQLTSNNVYWTGPNTGSARMYAPAAWAEGSSISHLNESTYPPGSGNNLMTYALSNGEAIHSPGPIVLNQMADMGWSTSAPITYGISGTIKDGSNVAISGVTVTISGNSSGTATTNSSGAFSFTNLTAGGTYTLTPSKTNYSFSPTNRVYSNLSVDQTAANFTGTPQPAISLSAASLAYGDVKTSQVSDKTLTITNTGLGVLTISSLSFTGVDTASFRLVGSPSLPVSINAGGNLVLTIRLAPANVGAKSANFRITHNAAGGISNVALTGNGTASSSIWSQNKTGITFDSIGYLSTPSDSGLLVSNTSSGDTLSITSVSYLGGNSKFSVAETFPVKIAYNTNRLIKIRFSPDSTGSFSGTITLYNNSSNNPTATLSVNGKVFGSNSVPSFSSVNFGTVGIGSGNKDTTIEIRNNGSYKLKIYSVSILTADTSFALASTLPSSGQLVDIGDKYNLVVRLKPNLLGSKTAVVTVNNNSVNNPNMAINISAVVQQSYLSFTPSSLAFDSTNVASPFRTLNIVISNSSTLLKVEKLYKTDALVTVYDKVITGDTSSFKLINKKVNVVVAPGSTDTIKVQFFPHAVGAKNAVLTITSNDLTPVRTINFSGNAGGRPVLNANLASINYGDFSAGKIKDTFVVVKNTGNLDLSISSKTFTGTDNSAFAFLSNGTPKILGYNESDSILFRFTASLPSGAKSAQLRINSNDPASPTYNVNLSANIKFASLSKSASTIQYSNTAVGSKSDTTFTIKNTGNSDLEISSMSIDGAYATDFVLGANYNSSKLVPNEERAFQVSFIPSDTGLRYAMLTINSNDPEIPADLIVLRGNGSAASLPSLSVTINKIDFGAVETGKFRDTTVSLKNSGSGILQIDSLNIIGINKNLFAIIGKTVPYSITSGQSDNFTLRFSPSGTSANGTLRIKSNDNQKPIVEIQLTGNVTQPALVLMDSIVDFGNVNVGDSSIKSVRIRNMGLATLKIDSIKSNENKSIFNYTLPAMPLYMLSISEYPLSITFKPSENKNYTSIVSVKSNDPNRPLRTIAFFGSGIAPRLLLSQQIDFGKVMVGDIKYSGFRIANAGNATLKVTAINLSGVNSSEFEVTGKVFPYNVTGGSSDSVTIKWTAKSIGVKDAKVKVLSNDLTSANDISISAEGILKVSVDNGESKMPVNYELKQNYPNPFNPSTKIRYSLKEGGYVSIIVFDVFGREVMRPINSIKQAGEYELNFDASSTSGGLTSGIYFYTIKVNNYSQTRKMVLMK
jgi:photosystem II stability/assembly factor-like uncharacterized protein